MRNKLVILLLIGSFGVNAQELVRNGGFENVTQTFRDGVGIHNCVVKSLTPQLQGPFANPTATHANLEAYFSHIDFWLPPANPSWCLIGAGSANVQCAQPAHEGTMYAWMAEREFMTQELAAPMVEGEFYAISFWTKNNSSNFLDKAGIRFYKERPTHCVGFFEASEVGPPHVSFPADLYNMSADVNGWIKVSTVWKANDNYSYLLLGCHGANNGARSTFWDDVSVIAMGCCQPTARYEMTSNLPPLTERSVAIFAGNDVGIPDIEGPVIVQPGQSVIFKAPHIDLGYGVDCGIGFECIHEGCIKNTNLGPEELIVRGLNMVFSPDGDGDNINLFIDEVFGAVEFKVEVILSHNNQPIYKKHILGILESPFLIWDGTCNQSGVNCFSPGSLANNGNYRISVYFEGCNGEEYRANYFVDLFIGSGKWEGVNGVRYSEEDINQENKKPTPATDIYKISLYPNPNNGQFKIETNVMGVEVIVTGIVGKVVYKNILTSTIENINISNFGKGFYIVKAINGSELTVFKVINK